MRRTLLLLHHGPPATKGHAHKCGPQMYVSPGFSKEGRDFRIVKVFSVALPF